MESLDPVNLKDVNKGFSKPAEYAAVLDRLARRNVYAITSFIFGLDHDAPGVAERTLAQVREWPPGLPVFGQITPFPSTPLYNRLVKDGRLMRPTHWLDFAPFEMAHTPLKMTVAEVQQEIKYAWSNAYSPENTRRAMRKIADAPAAYQLSHLIARLCFRGILLSAEGLRRLVQGPGRKPPRDFSHRGALSFELERLGYPGAAGSPAAPRC